MGLLTILKKMKQKEREMRLLILGLDNAGKTTVVKRLNGEDISDCGLVFLRTQRDTITPNELNLNVCVYCRSYKLNIWDVGGQKSLRSYWRNYFERTDGLVWVVDSADRQRMEDCRQELHKLLLEERLLGATLLVFANKQDLPGAMSEEAIQTTLALDDIKNHHWCIMGCSAVTGQNLLAGMDWLLDDIAARLFNAD
uniref:ADP-ribosylation factor-like protein 2 n=1 Tax=Hippocampus comes TaxID=109280 RepID=A0A3Q2YTX1_HIPCM